MSLARTLRKQIGLRSKTRCGSMRRAVRGRDVDWESAAALSMSDAALDSRRKRCLRLLARRGEWLALNCRDALRSKRAIAAAAVVGLIAKSSSAI